MLVEVTTTKNSPTTHIHNNVDAPRQSACTRDCRPVVHMSSVTGLPISCRDAVNCANHSMLLSQTLQRRLTH